HFLQRLGCAVEICTDVPFYLAVAADRLQGEGVGQIVDAGQREAEHVVAREVRTVRIRGIDVAGIRRGETVPDAGLICAEIRQAGRDVRVVVGSRRSAYIPGTDERGAAN